MKGIGNKGYMRTFEAVLAVIASFLFITFIVASRSPTDTQNTDINLISVLEENPGFRECIMNSDVPCLNSTLAQHYPDFVKVYAYDFNITSDPRSAPPELPDKDIHAESLFIAGNNTQANPRVVRLYYWDRS